MTVAAGLTVTVDITVTAALKLLAAVLATAEDGPIKVIEPTELPDALPLVVSKGSVSGRRRGLGFTAVGNPNVETLIVDGPDISKQPFGVHVVPFRQHPPPVALEHCVACGKHFGGLFLEALQDGGDSSFVDSRRSESGWEAIHIDWTTDILSMLAVVCLRVYV